jgi:lysophospholipase L1-like esterase
MRGSLRRTVGVLSAVVLSATGLTIAGTAPAQAATVESGTYVSLGDSLAFGYQPNLVAAGDFNPADYVSYAEDYAAMRPHLQLANFGCPGETTATLINSSGTLQGACPWIQAGLPTHTPYGGYSQLQAALAYIGAHPGTSLISVDIGSNDLLAILGQCGVDAGCIASKLPAVLGNYAYILGALKAAAPHAQLVVFNLYNPLALTVPGSDQLLTQYVNPAISQLAAAFGASVADAFTAMNHSEGSPAETAFVCSRTWECSWTPGNIHPTDLGYRQMAIALLQAQG